MLFIIKEHNVFLIVPGQQWRSMALIQMYIRLLIHWQGFLPLQHPFMWAAAATRQHAAMNQTPSLALLLPDHEYSSNQNSKVTLLCCWISPGLLPDSIHMGYICCNISLSFLSPSLPPSLLPSVDISVSSFPSHGHRPHRNTVCLIFTV